MMPTMKAIKRAKMAGYDGPLQPSSNLAGQTNSKCACTLTAQRFKM